jgi:predicted transcriptional regulator
MGSVASSCKRSRYEIISTILKISVDGVTITKIVYRANLNFKIAREYLTYLIKLDMIYAENINGKTVYKTTDKGKDFLKKFSELEDLTD